MLLILFLAMAFAQSQPLIASATTIDSYQLNLTQTDTLVAVQLYHGGRLRTCLRVMGWMLLLALIAATVGWLQLLKLPHYSEPQQLRQTSSPHGFFTFHGSSNKDNDPAMSDGAPNDEPQKQPLEVENSQRTTTNVAPTIASSNLLLQPGDYVYLRNDWDAAPIVIEKYKLLFFTVPKAGCTVWKLLFRRIMGYADWQSVDWTTMLPHHPERNGLKYLYDYSMEEANAMLTSPLYTKAIFVRDPKERLLSAYLDKALRNNGDYIRARCCYFFGLCVPNARESLEGFLNLTASCDDIHWRPQGRRMEAKYWPYVTFVGHLENAQNDAQRLLQSLTSISADGKTTTTAWNLYGVSGWGTYGNQSMFDSDDGRAHDTDADEQVKAYYTSLRLEQRVEQFYQSDYTNPRLNITLVRINK